ncbi:MAG: DUF4139 domain-containing protein [Deltaproteobacteria bacterium]|nr:DUF4139 domain-containing protein [Deltaproteobacteria bacterium]
MFALLLPFAFAAATDAPPPAAAAAERVLEGDGDRAVAIELPITNVMVFSDRARVTRSGPIRWGALAWPADAGAPKVVRVPDLPGAVLTGSLRVTAAGARVVRVEAQPVERERWSIEQVDAFLADLEKVTDQIALASGRLEASHESMAFLASLRAAAPVPEKDRLGKATPVMAPEAWRAVQEWLSKRRTAARTVEAASEAELRALSKELVRLQREVQRRELGAATDQRLQVSIIVEPERADGSLTVEYAVPGALWRPAYELFFEPDGGPDGGKVELLASGLVSQATGEDWHDVKLALSTAMPSLGIAMPKLHTWTLGDDREWVPRPSARTPPRRVSLFAPPTRRAALAELERDADKAVLASRMALLAAASTSPPPPPPRLTSPWRIASGPAGSGGKPDEPTPDPWEGEAEGDEERADVGSAGQAYREAQGMPAPSAAAPVMARPPPAPMPAGVAIGGTRAHAGVKTSAVESADDFGFDAEESTSSVTRSRREPSASVRGLALNPGRAWSKQELYDPTLPAVAAGGFDWVFEAPLATTVPSQAEQLRVPLASRSYQVQTFYEATPSLAKTAFLKATVTNGGKLPILAGPANVFVNRTFTGDAPLATTGPGGTLELPLGADENIRLTHSVVPATRTQGFLIGEEDVTDYTVKIEVGNYKKRPVTVRVIDQIPRTNAEKIKVELVSQVPTARAKPDADGLLYWHVDVPAGGTKTVTFTYRITRPKGWRLTQ